MKNIPMQVHASTDSLAVLHNVNITNGIYRSPATLSVVNEPLYFFVVIHIDKSEDPVSEVQVSQRRLTPLDPSLAIRPDVMIAEVCTLRNGDLGFILKSAGADFSEWAGEVALP